jgi:putative FmdB family regulatory protein
MILVDYRCPRCEGITERRVPAPPPAELTCPACGSAARRVFSPVRLGGVARAPGKPPPRREPQCRDDPGVPGICHMEPSAARAWAARAHGDNRALDREIERQERRLAAAPDEPVSPVHQHHVHHDHQPAGDQA